MFGASPPAAPTPILSAPRAPASIPHPADPAREIAVLRSREGRGGQASRRGGGGPAGLAGAGGGRDETVLASASVFGARTKRRPRGFSSAPTLSWTASRPASTISSRASLTRASSASIRRRRAGPDRRSWL